MYKLYGKPKTRSSRVAWMLEEVGAEWEFIHAEPNSADVTNLNPAGKIPVLETPDGILTESAAMMVYLSDKHDFLQHIKNSSFEMAKISRWAFWAVSELEPPIWLFTRNQFVFDPKIEQIPELAIKDINKAISYLSTELGNNDYITGNQFTYADAFITHTLMWIKMFKIDIERENVKNYMDRCLSRKAFVNAVKKEENSN